MATHAEILNMLLKQMNNRGFKIKMITPEEIQLKKLDRFFENILKIHFGETGDPRFYLVKNNGFLLAEVDDLVFAVAPFLPEPSKEDFRR